MTITLDVEASDISWTITLDDIPLTLHLVVHIPLTLHLFVHLRGGMQDLCEDIIARLLRATADPLHVMHDGGHVHWQNDDAKGSGDVSVQVVDDDDHHEAGQRRQGRKRRGGRRHKTGQSGEGDKGDNGEEEDDGYFEGDKGEEDDDARLDSLAAIDIEAELLQVATEGLSVIQRIKILQDPLACIRHFFTELMMKGCTLDGDSNVDELRAANCLKHVDKLMRTHVQQLQDLRQLRIHVQDSLVLLCSRCIDQKELQCCGLPKELRVRLNAAMGEKALENLNFLSWLGNSKQHIFEGPRPVRKKRQSPSEVQEFGASGSSDVALDGEMAAPDPANVPTPMMSGIMLFV